MHEDNARTLTKLQAEAAELYPMPLDGDRIENACAYAARHAHIVAKTVTEGPLFAAARALKSTPGVHLNSQESMGAVVEALSAAGFSIEEPGANE